MKIVSGIFDKVSPTGYNPRKDNFQDFNPTNEDNFWKAFTHAVENSLPSLGVVLSMISPEMYEYYNKGGSKFKTKAKLIIKDLHGRVKD